MDKNFIDFGVQRIITIYFFSSVYGEPLRKDKSKYAEDSPKTAFRDISHDLKERKDIMEKTGSRAVRTFIAAIRN